MKNVANLEKFKEETDPRVWRKSFLISIGFHLAIAVVLFAFLLAINANPHARTVTFELMQQIAPRPKAEKKDAPQPTTQPPSKESAPKTSSSAPPGLPIKKPPSPIQSAGRNLPALPSIPSRNQTASSNISLPVQNSSTAMGPSTSVRKLDTPPVSTSALRADVAETSSRPNPVVKANWQGKLVSRLERYKRYPGRARELHEEGTVKLRFAVNRQGRVLSSSIQKSSGSDALDAETLALVRRAQPLPPPPSEVPGEQIELVVPVQFQLDR